MGNLQDELKKKLLLRTLHVRGGKQLAEQSVGDRPSAEPKTAGEDSWKSGVQPLAVRNEVTLPPASRDAAVGGSGNSTPRVGCNPLRPVGLGGKRRHSASIKEIHSSIIAATLAADARAKDEAIRRGILGGYGSSADSGAKGPASQPSTARRVSAATKEPEFNSFRQPTLAREQEFIQPPAWVDAGQWLQAPNSTGRGRTLPLRIGIDFGTAYTKVAVRAADKVFFVRWDGVRQGGSRCLLPGELSIDAAGKRWLGRAPLATSVLADLKLPFVKEGMTTTEQEARVVAYLAWVMRYTRAWMYHCQSSLVRDRRLAWEVNIGCPTNSWTSSSIHSNYRRLGKLAWLLSQHGGGITDSGIRKVASRGDIADDQLGSIQLDGLHLVPEFVAQIAGYVQSPQRRDGLHMLVDIGAGTLDIATFNVFYSAANDEERFPIFASAVCPLGTHFLMHARLSGFKLDNQWDDMLATPDRDTLEHALGFQTGTLQETDMKFERRAREVVRSILHYTRCRRYPTAPEWTNGLPVFLAGGGCHCDVYRDAVMGAFADLHVQARYVPFPQVSKSHDGQQERDEAFHRLSVAYGLTFDATAGRRVFAPEQVPDFTSSQTVPDSPEWARQWEK